MNFFDVFLPIGRTNLGVPQSPCDIQQATETMDRYDIGRAMVYNVVSRDSDMEIGNVAMAEMLTQTPSERMHMIWGFDPAYVIEESPEDFLTRALANNVKAIVVNPNARKVRIDRSLRLNELASPAGKTENPTYNRTQTVGGSTRHYRLVYRERLLQKVPQLTGDLSRMAGQIQSPYVRRDG